MIKMNLLMKLRTEKNMTQAQFAKYLGLKTGQTISDIECGKIEVRDKHIKMISKKLGKDVARKIAKQKHRNYWKKLESFI